MGKRMFVDKVTGQLWLEDRVVGDYSILVDPYEIEEEMKLPTKYLEEVYKFAWNTDEDWVKEG